MDVDGGDAAAPPLPIDATLTAAAPAAAVSAAVASEAQAAPPSAADDAPAAAADGAPPAAPAAEAAPPAPSPPPTSTPETMPRKDDAHAYLDKVRACARRRANAGCRSRTTSRRPLGLLPPRATHPATRTPRLRADQDALCAPAARL